MASVPGHMEGETPVSCKPYGCVYHFVAGQNSWTIHHTATCPIGNTDPKCQLCDYKKSEAFKCADLDCPFNETRLIAKDKRLVQTPGPAIYSQTQWNILLAKTIESINKLSTVKGGEYAGDLDRLANFRRNASAAGCSMELVWRIYASKHWDAICQYLKDGQTGQTRPRSEPISGRVDDMIVYLILFKAILEEKGEP